MGALPSFKRSVSPDNTTLLHRQNAHQQPRREVAPYCALSPAAPVGMRQVSLPAHPEDEPDAPFPFGVSYTMGSVPTNNSGGASFTTDHALRFALRNSIHSRQGVFGWVRQGEQGLRYQLERELMHSDSVSLGQGVLVHGLSEVTAQNGVRHYQMLVSAPAQDMEGEVDTFMVPLTEMEVRDDRAGDSSYLDLAAGALQSHLSRVEWPYQDSVETPFVISHGCDDLADLHALHTEMTSRIQVGLVGSQRALLGNLQELAPVFVKGENRNELSRRLLPALQQQLTSVHKGDPAALQPELASKRHFFIYSESEPGEDFALANTELSLADKAPQCRPTERAAFRQLAYDNHCGIASVNGFFQAEVMRSAQAINHIVSGYARVYNATQLSDLNLPGLYHPKLLEGLQKGQSVQISKEEFVNGEGLTDYKRCSFIYMSSPEEQWDTLCNYKYPGAEKPDVMVVTPELWLSSATGIHLDSLESIVNALLQTKTGNPSWSAYPDKVERIAMDEDHMQAELEGRINLTIQAREGEAATNTQFPMICMQHGHFFAVARTDRGNWVKLDSSGVRVTGKQMPPLFAEQGQLAKALDDHKIIHVICEPLKDLERP